MCGHLVIDVPQNTYKSGLVRRLMHRATYYQFDRSCSVNTSVVPDEPPRTATVLSISYKKTIGLIVRTSLPAQPPATPP